MRRNGVFCGLGGGIAVALLVAFTGFSPYSVEAQVAPSAPSPGTAPRPPLRGDSGYAPSPQPSLLPAPSTGAAGSTSPDGSAPAGASTSPSTEPKDGPVPGQSLPSAGIITYTTPAGTATPSSENLKSESIDSLLNRLKTLKVQKAELERAELEVVALLRDKIREQKQQLQTLGIAFEEHSQFAPQPVRVPR